MSPVLEESTFATQSFANIQTLPYAVSGKVYSDSIDSLIIF